MRLYTGFLYDLYDLCFLFLWCLLTSWLNYRIQGHLFNPLSFNSDLSHISHCSIKGLSVREVMRIEKIIS